MATIVLTLLADGFEEIEATSPIDLLRRADAEVTVASCSDRLEITGRSNISLLADALLSDIKDPLGYDMLVIPGGPVVFELRKRPDIIDLTEYIREDILLSFPQHYLCSEQCEGLCVGCGANLNKESCSCSKPDKNNSFNILDELKFD